MEQKRAAARERQRRRHARLPSEEMQDNRNHNRDRMISAMEQKRAAAKESHRMRRSRLPAEKMQNNRNQTRDMMRERRNNMHEEERDGYLAGMRNIAQE